MKTIRFYIRLLSTLIGRYRFLILFGFLSGVFFFFLFPKIINYLPKAKGTLKYGLVGRYKINEIPLSIQKLISIGLTDIDEKGLPKPAIATSWEITRENKSYIFKLRPDLTWHDKKMLTAKDINYNLNDVSVEVIDPITIKFNLEETFAPFLDVVSKPIFKKGFIGLGDHKVNKITQNGAFLETIVLESLLKDKPNIKYSFYPTEQSAKTALKLGEVNHLSGIINNTGFDEWRNIKVTAQNNHDRYVALFFNLNKPNFEDKLIRQGLAYALKKDYGDNRTISPISPTSWVYNDEVKPYNYDIEKAKKAIEKKFTLKLLTVSSLLPEAEKIKTEWEQIGLKVEIGSYTGQEDFDVLLAIQEIPKDPDQYTLWHSTQAGNITNFKNARIDKLLEDGRKILDREQRKQIYFDFQRYLLEDLPVIFLYYPISYDIERT